jgi:hypothetical protein
MVSEHMHLAVLWSRLTAGRRRQQQHNILIPSKQSIVTLSDCTSQHSRIGWCGHEARSALASGCPTQHWVSCCTVVLTVHMMPARSSMHLSEPKRQTELLQVPAGHSPQNQTGMGVVEAHHHLEAWSTWRPLCNYRFRRHTVPPGGSHKD